MAALANGTAFKPASSAKMIEILKAQEFNEKIPAGLPEGTPVAHKTGDITGIHHDAAIVYPRRGAALRAGGAHRRGTDEKAADRIIADISRVVWERRRIPPPAFPPSPPSRCGKGARKRCLTPLS